MLLWPRGWRRPADVELERYHPWTSPRMRNSCLVLKEKHPEFEWIERSREPYIQSEHPLWGKVPRHPTRCQVQHKDQFTLR